MLIANPVPRFTVVLQYYDGDVSITIAMLVLAMNYR
jgi:hypothetical protein